MQVVHSVLHAVIFLSGMGMVGGVVSQYHFKEKKSLFVDLFYRYY